ncbi:MAG TPA: GlsB/YeaQ/YmgE family stress response membrane protein [Candidatus Dormibacteraeota bacterium]|nr:GlsB/YeaQ/YmgE family stress response membrane protein [Candidatus Dormibacteraeota bacterium]
MALSPGGIIAWIIVGLIAGWAAGKVSRGHGFGLIGDLVVGLIGALVGGLIAGAFIQGSVGFIGSIIVAFLGALLLLALIRLLSGHRTTA